MTSAGTVLLVCRANVCRSAMAAAILADLAGARGVDLTVTSAGIRAYQGQPISDGAAAELVRRGVPPVPHASHLIDANDAVNAQLVITASRDQRDRLGALAPFAWPRTFVLTELGQLLREPVGHPDGLPVSEVAALANERRRLASGREFADLADPMGRGPEAYEACADIIVAALAPLVALLAPTGR